MRYETDPLEEDVRLRIRCEEIGALDGSEINRRWKSIEISEDVREILKEVVILLLRVATNFVVTGFS